MAFGFKPVTIFVGGQELLGYTGMTLSRSKEELTGSLGIDVFFTYMPDKPVIFDAAIAKEVAVYIGGEIAFLGKLDKRKGSGIRHGDEGTSISSGSAGEAAGLGQGFESRAVNIGPNEYTVKLTARGKTKYLVDSSHQVTENLLKTTNRKTLEKLLEPFQIDLDWMATVVDIDKVRFRDGAKVVDEIRRVGVENGHYIYETRDGKLRVTDDIGPGTGEPLILGDNILSFSAEQSEDDAKSEITVKGQRTEKDKWGEEAILPPVAIVKDEWVQSFIPINVQHYGNGTDEALKRRARFEANKRSSRSKTVTIEVFHVQPRSGQPWDVGTLHYVEIPPEGIFDIFECTSLNYTVTNNGELKTTLTLSPPPVGGGATGSGLASFGQGVQQLLADTGARRAALGVTFAAGQYPSPWSGPSLIVQAVSAFSGIVAGLAGVSGLASLVGGTDDSSDKPPMQLPPSFKVQGGTND